MKAKYFLTSLAFFPVFTHAQPFQSDYYKLVEQGNEQYENGEYEKAKTCYKDALLLKPESAVAQKNLALALANMEENVSAEEEFERFSTLTESQIKKAEAEYNIGKLKLDVASAALEEQDAESAIENALAAIQHFTAALDIDPTSESAKKNRAQAQHLLRKIAEKEPPPEEEGEQGSEEGDEQKEQNSDSQENQPSDSNEKSQDQPSDNQQGNNENQDSEKQTDENESENPQKEEQESQDEESENEEQEGGEADHENEDESQSGQSGKPSEMSHMTKQQAEALLEMLGDQQSLVLSPPSRKTELIGELNW